MIWISAQSTSWNSCLYWGFLFPSVVENPQFMNHWFPFILTLSPWCSPGKGERRPGRIPQDAVPQLGLSTRPYLSSARLWHIASGGGQLLARAGTTHPWHFSIGASDGAPHWAPGAPGLSCYPLKIYIYRFAQANLIFWCSFFFFNFLCYMGVPGGSDSKVSACNVEDLGSIPGLGRSPGEGNGNLLQYSCLENSMDRGAWKAIVHGVTELDTTEQLHW